MISCEGAVFSLLEAGQDLIMDCSVRRKPEGPLLRRAFVAFGTSLPHHQLLGFLVTVVWHPMWSTLVKISELSLS